jgi:phosphoglycolate phosphatase
VPSAHPPAPSPFSLFVFDLDGTLIDSRRDLADAANTLLVECGGRALPEDDIGRMVGDGAATLVARVFEAAHVPAPADALARFLAEYGRHLLDHTRPYAGIPEALEALSARARLALLTNKPLASTREILRGLDLVRFFSDADVIGGDGPFPRKPDPAGLRHLTSAAGVDAGEAILVGDSIIDWRTARQAGTAICMARYGFGFEGFPAGELAAGDRVVDAPAHLLDL